MQRRGDPRSHGTTTHTQVSKGFIDLTFEHIALVYRRLQPAGGRQLRLTACLQALAANITCTTTSLPVALRRFCVASGERPTGRCYLFLRGAERRGQFLAASGLLDALDTLFKGQNAR
jgi:hypothetical protein